MRRQRSVSGVNSIRQESTKIVSEPLEGTARRAERQRLWEVNVSVGDLVLRKDFSRPSKLHPTYDGPYVISSISPSGVVHLKAQHHYRLKNHYNMADLKHYAPAPSEASSIPQEARYPSRRLSMVSPTLPLRFNTL